jgi:Na+/H+-dicarboxylate symporter
MEKLNLAQTPLWLLTLTALVFGTVLGGALPEQSLYLKPVGSLFLQALKMLIVPLVLVSITHAVGSIQSVGGAGRIGVFSLLWYVATTLTVVPLGLILMSFIEVAPRPDWVEGLKLDQVTAASIDINQLIPANVVEAMASNNILGLIFFSLLLGLAANKAGDSGVPFRAFMESTMEVVQQLTRLVVACAPVGVFALMASTTAQYGLAVLSPLLQLIGIVYLGCLLHVLVTLHLLLRVGAGVQLGVFLKGIFPAQLMAFSTTTAAGTLPESMRCAESALGVRPSVSRFVLPIGATINMDGTALYQLLVALFVAQWAGIDLSVSQLLTLSLTVVLMSIGTAAIPSGGLIVLSAVLASVGLPLEAVAMVAGIDRILDMARTTVNVTGDLAVTKIIDHNVGDI